MHAENQEHPSGPGGLPAVVEQPTRPGFVLFSVPLRPDPKAPTAPRHVTLLAVRDRGGNVLVPASTTAWSVHLAHSCSPATVTQSLAVIGRFYEYVERVHDEDEDLDAAALTDLVYAYVAFRAGEARPGDPDAQAIPDWKVVRRVTAWSEFKTLARFFGRCGVADIKLDLLAGLEPPTAFNHWATQKRHDFFAHLAPQRERWRRLNADPDRPLVEGPPIRPLPMKGALVSEKDVMEPEDVRALWRSERNPVLRALFILLAYGGPRISEALNIWAVDVMPGSWSRNFADFDQTGMPFVALAEPSQSSWTGDIRSTRVTRVAKLAETWDLRPRSTLPKRHPMRAGWKGMMLLNNDMQLSWVCWTEVEAAKAFEEAATEIRAILRRNQSAERHPYFFVNAGPGPRHGEPLTYKMAVRGFDRAAARIGMDRTRAHRNIHGFRHYYVWVLREVLQLKPEIRQIMLHHKSMESQKAYGVKASDVHKALAKVYGGRFA